jgi:Tat protein secretion system quality control protein TatD with DNase activity
VTKRIAEIRGVTPEKIAAQTTETARAFFRI